MRVIRPIRANEAERFLEVLCEVFDLDFQRAKFVFFQEPSFDLNRKWALFEDSRMVSILTTAPLSFVGFKAVGIAGVATLQSERGKGYAASLIEEVCAVAKSQGDGGALLFAKNPMLYARCGFEVLDRVVQGPIHGDESEQGDGISFQEAEARYGQWSAGRSGALLRDEKRWELWRYNLKVVEGYGPGYLCFEGTTMREAIVPRLEQWPVPRGTDWYGLHAMTELMGVPGDFRDAELFLMGRDIPSQPLMFMTDQF